MPGSGPTVTSNRDPLERARRVAAAVAPGAGRGLRGGGGGGGGGDAAGRGRGSGGGGGAPPGGGNKGRENHPHPGVRPPLRGADRRTARGGVPRRSHRRRGGDEPRGRAGRLAAGLV